MRNLECMQKTTPVARTVLRGDQARKDLSGSVGNALKVNMNYDMIAGVCKASVGLGTQGAVSAKRTNPSLYLRRHRLAQFVFPESQPGQTAGFVYGNRQKLWRQRLHIVAIEPILHPILGRQGQDYPGQPMA